MKIKQISKFRKVNLNDFEEFKFSEIADYVNSTGLYEIKIDGRTAVVYITEDKKYFLKGKFFKKQELPVYTFLQKIDDRWLNDKALELKAKKRVVKRCIYPQYMSNPYTLFFMLPSCVTNNINSPVARTMIQHLLKSNRKYKIHLP